MKSVPVVLTSAAVWALAVAAPAGAADADAFGTYSFTTDDGENATWTLTPCTDDPPGCARVSASGTAERAPWVAEAHWSVGSWILVVPQPDAIPCPDGSALPGAKTYSWDSATLAGNAGINTNGACGAKPSLSTPFRLARIGAAEAGPPAPAPAPPPPGVPAPPVTAAAPEPAEPLAAESTATGPVEQPAPEPATPPPSG